MELQKTILLPLFRLPLASTSTLDCFRLSMLPFLRPMLSELSGIFTLLALFLASCLPLLKRMNDVVAFQRPTSSARKTYTSWLDDDPVGAKTGWSLFEQLNELEEWLKTLRRHICCRYDDAMDGICGLNSLKALKVLSRGHEVLFAYLIWVTRVQTLVP